VTVTNLQFRLSCHWVFQAGLRTKNAVALVYLSKQSYHRCSTTDEEPYLWREFLIVMADRSAWAGGKGSAVKAPNTVLL